MDYTDILQILQCFTIYGEREMNISQRNSPKQTIITTD